MNPVNAAKARMETVPRQQREAILMQIVEKANNSKMFETALLLATALDHPAILERFYQAGDANLDKELLTGAVDNDAINTARFLLDHGANPNAHVERMFPLHLAVRRQNMAMLKLLLDRGADPDVRAQSGATPLMHAIMSKQLDFAAVLLERGADETLGLY
ncbi:hypothetical protein GGF31_002769 [Allomyces arbusculus]|nr:hypothetical protein GGF31_002769 [Allomyces arbusculus]